MIKRFGDSLTENLYNNGRERRLPADIAKGALRKLAAIENATSINDLREPPSNHLEALKGDLEGFYSIRINKQWRIIFRWTGSDASDVSIVDYHK